MPVVWYFLKLVVSSTVLVVYCYRGLWPSYLLASTLWKSRYLCSPAFGRLAKMCWRGRGGRRVASEPSPGLHKQQQQSVE